MFELENGEVEESDTPSMTLEGLICENGNENENKLKSFAFRFNFHFFPLVSFRRTTSARSSLFRPSSQSEKPSETDLIPLHNVTLFSIWGPTPN